MSSEREALAGGEISFKSDIQCVISGNTVNGVKADVPVFDLEQSIKTNKDILENWKPLV